MNSIRVANLMTYNAKSNTNVNNKTKQTMQQLHQLAYNLATVPVLLYAVALPVAICPICKFVVKLYAN
jgi:hypothetical protein